MDRDYGVPIAAVVVIGGVALVSFGVIGQFINALVSLSARGVGDIDAQQSMASAAWGMFYVALVQTVVGFGTVVGIALAYLQGRRELFDHRRAAEVQSQAYVHAKRAEFGQWNNVLIWCRNTGQTPATHFSVAGGAYIVKRGNVGRTLDFSARDFKTWSVLPANSELSVSLEFENHEEIARFRAGLHDRSEVLVVSGVISYCTVFNHDHETHFAFYVDHINRRRFRRPTANHRAYFRLPGQDRKEHRRQFPSVWDNR